MPVMSQSEAIRRYRSAILQSGHQGRRRRERQLRLETVEQRKLLAAPTSGKFVPRESLVAASPQRLDAMPAGFAHRIDTINGEQVVSIADPAFAGQLDGASAASISGGALHTLGEIPQLHSNP